MLAGVPSGPAVLFADSSSDVANLTAPALWQCRLPGQTKSALCLQQHPSLLTGLNTHVCMLSKGKLKCPHCTDLYGPAEEYLPPSLHSYSLPRISVFWSDISITVTISPSDWSPLASKLGYFPALRWRKHFVGSIINLTTKLCLVLSQVIKQSHGRKMTQFKGCS